MIITKTPLRISIGGGGTDLPVFYPKYGASIITSTIDKYIYVMVSGRKFHNDFRIAYSTTENVEKVADIKNTRVKAALELLDIQDPLEISTISEVPGSSGLGSSSAFLVGLLKALHAYKGEHVSAKLLAEEAAKIEIEILGEPIGKQDQYATAYGGFINLSIGKTGNVLVSPLNIKNETLKDLENHLYMFYTGIQRSASEVLKDQAKNVISDGEKLKHMQQIKEIGIEIKNSLESDNTRRFGEWMNVHWETKKKMSGKMTNSQIDNWYEVAMKSGAIGGKIMGAGGGGFLLFYTERKGSEFIKSMQEEGLKFVPFKFDFEGCKIISNII
jgi:D-glycero-alpha-D-manno-heptose-7-phosphate kinase